VAYALARTLAFRTHPPHGPYRSPWQIPLQRFDLIAIGGGTAGLVTAAGAAGVGARTALIERHRMGGDCLWTGCVPSKALIACANAAHSARTSERYGVAAAPRVDFERAVQWVHGARDRIAPNDSPERFRALGVDVIEGDARVIGGGRVEVNGVVMEARHIVIATGSAPSIPDIPGLTTVDYHTTDTIFEIRKLPDELTIIGAGAIGLELGQAFARLGSRVRVIETAAALLPREDHELVELLRARLEGEGVELLLDTSIEQVRRDGPRIRLDCRSAGTPLRPISPDALLVAAGRQARTSGLGLEAAGVEATARGIVVDATLRTTAKGIWAAGDVTGGPLFTHVADYQARLVVRNALFPLAATADYRAIPWVTFTDPELAHVGLHENEARERFGSRVRVWRKPFADVDRGITDGETAGMVKIVTDARGRILGGHILGARAGSMIGEITLAMKHGLPVRALANLVHPYPTHADAIRQASLGFDKARFTGPVKKIVGCFARR